MVNTKYRKNSKWSSITFVYSIKEDLDRMIQYKLEEKYKQDNSINNIDIVDINISATKNYDFKYVIVLYAII